MITGLFSAMKNEGPFVLEWVAFHKIIGFDRILVYTNECDDGTYEILDALNEIGVVKHIRQNLKPDEIPQYVAADAAYSDPYLKNADWIMWLDADEFLFVDSTGNQVVDLINKFSDASGIAINWKIFGDSGLTHWSPELVTQSFTKCAYDGHVRNTGFKTIFRRTEHIRGFGIHRPFLHSSFRKTGNTIVNSAGREMHEEIYKYGSRRRHGFGTAPAYLSTFEGASICHYASKTYDSYLLKRARGQGDKAANSTVKSSIYKESYWLRYNLNDNSSLEMLQIIDRLVEEINSLLSNNKVFEAQKLAVKLYARKINQIRG